MIYFQKNMSNKISLFLIVIVGLLALNSCSGIKKGLGIEKDSPNEFLIEKKAPLVIPPEYKLLPPDSETKIKEIKKSNNSLKEVLDKNLNMKESETKPSGNAPADIEKEIIKQLK